MKPSRQPCCKPRCKTRRYLASNELVTSTEQPRASGQRKPQRLSWSTVQFPSSSPVPSVQFGFPGPWLPPAELWPKPQWAAILVLTADCYHGLSQTDWWWSEVSRTTPGKVSGSPLGSRAPPPGRLAILSSGNTSWLTVVLLTSYWLNLIMGLFNEKNDYTLGAKLNNMMYLFKFAFWASKRVLTSEI